MKLHCPNCQKPLEVDVRLSLSTSAITLRNWRKASGFTMKQAALSFGVSESFWSLMESGKRKVTERILKGLKTKLTKTP